MGKTLVIVESPTKANTIRRFLPDSYDVRSSVGHVRDLPRSADEIPAAVKGEAWAELGVDVTRGFEPVYIVPGDKKKVVQELKRALADADELLLATDEDREGESISWHLLELLKPKVPARRMVFHEITDEAIAAALKNPRTLDDKLVRAQETRRVLDRLVGYRISPLLWRKIGGKLSAGRVQSAAVRLLVLRERERLAFRQGSYWDLKAALQPEAGRGDVVFEATLLRLDGERLAAGKDFDEATGRLREGVRVRLLSEAEARALATQLKDRDDWQVLGTEAKPTTRRPFPPFTTSTLQQEANRKLGLSAAMTMSTAQELYQQGFITYMRTDSVFLSEQAISAARDWVRREYGDDFLHEKPRRYQTKAKGAQEAHEAIRPSGNRFRSPRETGLSGRALALYDLIWKRTVASQMADAKQTQLAATIGVGPAEFRATGRRTDFPGFLRAYVEGSDDPDELLRDRDVALPDLAEGDRVSPQALEPVGHETQPPGRFTEASLVQALEKEGIGRPSTYASIIGTILDRGYARVDRRALVPTFRAFAVTQFMERYFPQFVDLGFTAEMERALDEIAAGDREWLPYLERFYLGDEGLDGQVELQSERIDVEAARRIDLGVDLGADVRIGRFGPYLEADLNGETVRANLPEDLAPGDIDAALVERLLRQRAEGPESLGTDPATGKSVYVLDGRFGPYVQLGEVSDEDPKPPRASLLKGMRPDQLALDTALALLALPRELGAHPEGGRVLAGVGRFGPFVLHEQADGSRDYRSLKAGDDVLEIGLSRGLELLAEPKGGRRGAGAAKALRDLGPHPEDGAPVQILDGRFGPYVKHGKINATLPKGSDPEQVSMAQAVELIAAKAARGKGGRKAATKRAGGGTAKKRTTGKAKGPAKGGTRKRS